MSYRSAEGKCCKRSELRLRLVALEQEIVAGRTEAVLRAIRVVEVAVGRVNPMRVLAPAVALPRDLERLDPGVRLVRAWEEHPGPDLVLADVLAVRRDHRVQPEILLHLDDRGHRVVDPPVQHVGGRLVHRPELLDQRQPEPAVDWDAIRRAPLEGNACALGGLHGRSPFSLGVISSMPYPGRRCEQVRSITGYEPAAPLARDPRRGLRARAMRARAAGLVGSNVNSIVP